MVPPHADDIVELLHDGFLRVRQAVVSALGQLGPAGARHAGKLVPLLADSHLRHLAILSLSRLGCHEANVAALFVSAEWYVRREVLLALADFGRGSVVHEEAILRLLSDQHRDVRFATLGALAALPPSSAARGESLLRALAGGTGEEFDIRRAAEALLTTLP